MNNQKRLKDVCARLDKPPPPLPELCCWCLALSFPPRRGGLALSSGLWRPCGFCSFFVWYSCSCGFVPIRFSLSHLWINWRAYWLFWSLVVWFASRVLPIYFYFIFRLPLFSLCCWLFILWFLFDMWRVHLQEQINIILKRSKPRSVWLMFIWVHSWKKMIYDERLKQTDLFVNRRRSEVEAVKYEDSMKIHRRCCGTLLNNVKSHELVTNRRVKIHRY